MSTFFLADRIKELSRTETTGPIVLDGAVTGFSSFGDFYASGDVVFYAITDNVKYEVGSGVYEPNGGNRVITRHPLRSSDMDSGPYYVNGDEASGPAGYYYPLYLTRSAAQSGVSFADGPYTDVSELTFVEFPGVTFYRPSEHAGYSATVGISGSNYNTLASPVDFDAGVKEVFVTYPGKSAVINGYGLDSDTNEPKDSGVAFWRNEQILNYSNQLVWDDTNNRLGIAQVSPQYALDIGGSPSFSILNVSGILEGGSGILFSGGQLTYTGATASGGKQLEPFLRNEVGQGANGVIEFSGVVDQYVGIATQTPGTVFAGPTVDHCGTPPCDPDYPSFRLLEIDDIPLAALVASGNFVIQKNLGLDSQTANITPDNYVFGMIPMYAGSGNITYDSGILFDYNNNRLLVGGDASSDTAGYTLDARGTIGSQSGYLNQLIFTDDLIRIGTDAGTDDGNLTENYFLIGLGHSAGKGVSGIYDGLYAGHFAGLNSDTGSGIVMIGVSVGQSSTNINESVGIGTDALRSADTILSGVIVGQTAAQTMVSGTNVIAIGPRAMMTATEFSEVVAAGSSAAKDASGVYNSVVIGNLAALSADELASGVAIGFGAASGSVGSDNIVAIGHQAAASINDSSDVVSLGSQAAMNASGTKDSINIGREAGVLSSGENHIFIGQGAGYASSGNGNIEITNSGTLITGANNDKVNIGGVLVGDTTAGKLSIGSPSGLSPLATLTVEPADVDDAAFIIRVVDSGSVTPPMQIQSGDGTTFYSVSNSGNVANAGWSRPSGGLWLSNVDPSRDSGVGGHMLWNNGNTLTWNGAPVGGAGSFTSWSFNAEGDAGTITDGQGIIVSGISGIQVIGSGAGNRNWTVDGGELSGILVELSGQIVASNYSFYTAASGDQLNNNSGYLMPTNSWLVMSGVNGIEIDVIDRSDGTNNSGIFEISYNPTAAYSWFATNGDVANDEIADADVVTVSGVSGIRVEYDASTNFFRVGASGLSGVLQGGIDANLGYLSNENGPISVSGLSGIAAYASGQVDTISQGGAASGLIKQNNTFIMDPDGSGNLSVLSFPNNGGSVILRGDSTDPITNQGGDNCVLIGSRTSVNYGFDGTSDDVIAIGSEAFGTATPNGGNRSDMIIIGHNAFSTQPVGSTFGSIAIGTSALTCSSGVYNIAIGYEAGAQGGVGGCSRRVSHTVDIGYKAGSDQHQSDGIIYTSRGAMVNIGYEAGRLASSGRDSINIGYRSGAGTAAGENIANANCVNIGLQAGFKNKHGSDNVSIGTNAFSTTSGAVNSVSIGNNSSSSSVGGTTTASVSLGYLAMYSASGANSAVSIGEGAGYQSSGNSYSILMGRNAGSNRQNSQSIIMSNDNQAPGTNDLPWCDYDQSLVIDIGHCIQGKLGTAPTLHIGAGLNSTYRTLSDIDDSVLNITPGAISDSDLKLNLTSSDGATSFQSAGLMKTQTKDGTTIQSVDNEIIDNNGFLRLPEGTGTTGTFPNVVLWANGDKVIPGEGVVATYDFGGGDIGLAVALDNGGTYVWYKIAASTLMS